MPKVSHRALQATHRQVQPPQNSLLLHLLLLARFDSFGFQVDRELDVTNWANGNSAFFVSKHVLSDALPIEEVVALRDDRVLGL